MPEVKLILKNIPKIFVRLDTRKYYGLHGIPAILLKNYAPELALT